MFMFQRSILPSPSALANTAGCTGLHATSYTYSELFSNEHRGIPVLLCRGQGRCEGFVGKYRTHCELTLIEKF